MNTEEHLPQETKKGKASIVQEKNLLAMDKKGYVKLYDGIKSTWGL